MNTIVNTITPTTLKPLIWKTDVIPDYYIRSDGVLFHNDYQLSSWRMNGRNYSKLNINGHVCAYRIDYMVAYTFLGMKSDAIRLIHINDDITDDRVDNLIWYRKIDVKKEYINLSIVEPDGSIIEEWRPCTTEYNPDLHYEVSNLGLIRDENHNLVKLYDSHGYRVFYYLDSKFAKQTRIKSVHRAVAEAFIPNPKQFILVNHIDGNKYNDIVVNLEWVDTGMNAEHAYLQNLNHSTRYTLAQIHSVCKLISDNSVPQIHISYMTGVDRKTVSDIYRGRRWKEVAAQYNMPEKKWTSETKSQIQNMIISGKKGREIFAELNIEYNQSAISLYERMRRELKSKGLI